MYIFHVLKAYKKIGVHRLKIHGIETENWRCDQQIHFTHCRLIRRTWLQGLRSWGEPGKQDRDHPQQPLSVLLSPQRRPHSLGHLHDKEYFTVNIHTAPPHQFISCVQQHGNRRLTEMAKLCRYARNFERRTLPFEKKKKKKIIQTQEEFITLKLTFRWNRTDGGNWTALLQSLLHDFEWKMLKISDA